MRTLWIKLTAQQEADLRKTLGMADDVVCQHLAIKIPKDQFAAFKRGENGGTIVAYNGPPHGGTTATVGLG